MDLLGQGAPGGAAQRLELGPVLGQGQQHRGQKGPSLGGRGQAGRRGSHFSEPPAFLWPFLGDPFIRLAWTHKLFRAVQGWGTWEEGWGFRTGSSGRGNWVSGCERFPS